MNPCLLTFQPVLEKLLPALSDEARSRLTIEIWPGEVHDGFNQLDRQQRYGGYYTFFWRSNRKADLTLRFEYRQLKLGSYVQAKEIAYPAVKGSVESHFKVIGDDYLEEGKVTAWRAILIENGRIVGVTQSFLWN